MTISHSVLKDGQFLMHGYTSINDRNRIHHFSQTKDSGMIQICFHFACSKDTSVVIHMRSRYTGRHHDIDICRHFLRLFQDIVNSIRS